MTPEEDDIISISHKDIMSNVCEVSLEKLSGSDLEEIKATLKETSESSDAFMIFDTKGKKEGESPTA